MTSSSKGWPTSLSKEQPFSQGTLTFSGRWERYLEMKLTFDSQQNKRIAKRARVSRFVLCPKFACCTVSNQSSLDNEHSYLQEFAEPFLKMIWEYKEWIFSHMKKKNKITQLQGARILFLYTLFANYDFKIA